LSSTLSAHFVENGQKPEGSTKFCTKARDKVGSTAGFGTSSSYCYSIREWHA
jgi:hypothetical protein